MQMLSLTVLEKDIGTDISGGDNYGGGLRIKLTPEGVAALRYGQALHEPRGVFEPRPNLAVQGKTVLECICKLKGRGFEWRLLLDSLAVRAALPAYQLGVPRSGTPHADGWSSSDRLFF